MMQINYLRLIHYPNKREIFIYLASDFHQRLKEKCLEMHLVVKSSGFVRSKT